MNRKVKLERNVFIIIACILLLATTIQITHTSFILKGSRNESLSGLAINEWKPTKADPATLKPSGKPYCIAYTGNDSYSAKVKDQAVHELGYMKKPVKSFDLSREALQPESCVMLIVALQDLRMLGDTEQLLNYVKQGGYALMAGNFEKNDAFYRLYRKMGILDAGNYTNTDGLELTSNILIGEMGLKFDNQSLENSTLTVDLDEKSRVLARSERGIPLIWDYSYGKGKFMVFNGTMLQIKFSRGLLAGAISLLEPDFIYPIFNMNLMYIDDFPAPIAKTVDPIVYREYHRDRPHFFKEIWWPDMLRAGKRFNLKYTAALIQSYNDHVEPPFASPVDEDSKALVSYGREVLKSGGEIGLHGYNHQSLLVDQTISDEFDYHAWGSIESMSESITEAVRFLKTAFPRYTMMSYVPPSNALSPEGREALKRAWPNMAIISSLYGDDDNGVSYAQEYEIAPDDILEMPRVTSGYSERPFDRFAEANMMTSLGIISHFIHPDDMLDEERGLNLGWEQLYEKFTDMLARRERTYPWLRSMTSTEAAIDMEHVLNSRVDWNRSGNHLQGTISPYSGDMYFILRSEREIKSLIHCEAKKIDTRTFLIVAHQANFDIELGD